MHINSACFSVKRIAPYFFQQNITRQNCSVAFKKHTEQFIFFKSKRYVSIIDTDDMLWEIEEAKYVPDGEDGAYYVSVQSYNKAGLYLCYDITTGEVIITQDSEDPETAQALTDKKNMSFETLRGEDGGVMFRCVANGDFYLASVNGKLVVSSTATVQQRTFSISTETGNRTGVYEANNGVVFA